ncbi:spore coat protein GerQ [Paenibacillus sp. GCM10027627]|uniref:spore coat protein GerQ n=1 Tax=unclassified Paenibacillus TaxID=185978 RepID=UPI0036402E1A
MTNGYGYKPQVSYANAGPNGFPNMAALNNLYGYGGYSYAQPYAAQSGGIAQTSAMPTGAQAAGGTPPTTVPSGSFVTPSGGNIVTVPGAEESYVENILRLNRGKLATFYMTYENNREWNAKIFKGVIEAAGRDHIVISDPSTGMRYLLLMLNLDYVTFNEQINYEYPFQGGVVTPSTPMGS